MKKLFMFLAKALLSGFLIVVPIYVAVLLLLKAMKSVAALVRPVALLLPGTVPAETILSLLVVIVVCLLVGVLTLTRVGDVTRERIEKTFFERIPGYELIRSLTQQIAGKGVEDVWKPALAEFDDGLVPAFIIEHLDDGRFTVFVPSVPTPLAGAVYILEARRVHAVDVPFTEALKVVSRWGSGAKHLVAAMERSAVPASM